MSGQHSTARRLTQAVVNGYRHNHLVRNSGWVIIATGVTGLLGLAFWAEAIHAFSDATVGSTSAVIAAMAFASTLARMGLGTTALQVLPQADEETWSTAVNAVVLVGALFGLGAGLATMVVLPHLSPHFAFAGGFPVAVWIVLGTSATTVAVLLDDVFTAERATHYIVIRGATFGILKLVFLSALLVLGVRNGAWLIGAWVVGSILTSGGTLLYQIRRLGRRHRYAVTGVVRYMRKWLRILVLHHLTALGAIMIPSLMPVLVVARLSSVASAHFYIAWLLSSILFTVSAAVAGNLLADLSYGDEPMERKLRRASRLIAGLLLPPIIVMALFGHQILGIFGPTYAAQSYGILLLFVVVAIPDAVTNVYVTILRARRQPHKAAAMSVAMAAVALGGAWYLMGPLGVAGAAWAWALAQGVGCAYVATDAWGRRGGRPTVSGPLSTPLAVPEARSSALGPAGARDRV
jgi:O-antigen/teichoic acid export membrane protein